MVLGFTVNVVADAYGHNYFVVQASRQEFLQQNLHLELLNKVYNL